MQTLRDLLRDLVALKMGHGRVRRPVFWALFVWSASIFYLAALLDEVTGRPTLTWILGFALFVGPWFWYFLVASRRKN